MAQSVSSLKTNNVNTSFRGGLEFDSHADLSRISPECKILTVTEKVCQVNPYQPEYEGNWQSTHSSRSNSL